MGKSQSRLVLNRDSITYGVSTFTCKGSVENNAIWYEISFEIYATSDLNRGTSAVYLPMRTALTDWLTFYIIITIIIKVIYIAQVRKGHKCAMSAEMAVWLRNCLYLYSYLSHS